MNDEAAFGEHPAGRFGADVEYRGRADGHDFVVQVRHRLLDTSFTVEIDGVLHDPVAEQKAEMAAKKAAKAAEGAGESADEVAAEELTPPADGLRFRVDEGFTTLRCTVRREREGAVTSGDEAPDDEPSNAEVEDAEVLVIRTAGLGGAGEVEVRHGLDITALAPVAGTPSAARDARRTAHPTRYALIAALTTSVKFLIPLLGLGALLSGVLDPLKEWVEARIRPVVEAVATATAPAREWLADLIRPVTDFLGALLQPVRDLLRWLIGLLPDFSFPFGVPDWLADVLVPVMVVLAAFLATRSALQRRREQLLENAAPDGGERAAGQGDEVSVREDAGSSREDDPREDLSAHASARPAGKARNASRSAGDSSTQN